MQCSLVIDEEFRALIPPLSDEERGQLESNLIADGCRDPLVVWSPPALLESILIDGHNRYEICTRLQIPFDVTEVELEDREAAKDWIDRNQIGRRNLSPDGFRLLIGRIYNRRKKAQGGNGSNQHEQLPQSEAVALRTSEQVAAEFGTSRATVERAGKAVAEIDGTALTAEVAGGRVKLNEAAELARGMREVEPDNQRYTLEEARVKIKADKAAKHAIRDAERKAREAAANQQNARGDYRLVQGDAFRAHVDAPAIDLLITDPPYSTDVDDIEAFVAWMDGWLPLIKPTGRAYIFTGAYPHELHAYLRHFDKRDNYGMTLDNVLVWTYRNAIGPSPKNGYKLNWQACFYLYGADAPPLECPSLLEQFTVQEVNAPDARTGVRYHTWQKPDELAERLIRHSTSEGQLIADPFAGTGTFVAAASRLNRQALGIEKNPDMLDICRSRGLQVAQ